ncbi:MAG TPA: hypothetical protein V6D05_06045 [Stenomitos sp.]
MAAKRLLPMLGLAAFTLAVLLPSGRSFAHEAKVKAPPMPAVAADQVLVQFKPEVGPYFVKVIDLVIGTKGATPAGARHTWQFGIGDRGTREDYATLFATLPYVAQVWPQPNEGAAPQPAEKSYVEGELLVKFKSGVTQAQIDAFNAQQGVTILDKISGIEVYRLKLPAGKTVEAMQRVYSDSPLVEYAEPNQKVSVPLLPEMPSRQRPKPPAKPGTGSVDVHFAPGTNPELINLVYGTRTLGPGPEGTLRLAPSPKASAPTEAQVLKLCPSVESAIPSS